MLRRGMFLADRYEIMDRIGTGGMSDVYRAKCHKLNRFVAIKVLKQEFSEDKTFVSKFNIEAQSAAGLMHPNIVNVYDVGDENGIHYIVMELVEGITLKKYIEKKGRLSSKEAISIAIQVAQGIEAAHSHHIVHRDIKPQNIIISKDGKVKVTDFGIARAATSQTINSSAMGSVHYISPEQARGGYSDEKSDIYSFGITLYEMLTGTVPFDGDSTVAVAVQHIQDEIPPASSVVDDIPISVDKIVTKCTQKKTERRYQSATELIADLKKSLVMPDVDFVKMMPMYGDTIVAQAEDELKTDLINSLQDEDEDSLYDDDDDDVLDEDDDDDDYDDDDEDDDDEDDEDEEASKDDEEDIEDGGNEKLDKIMKYIGIGIVVMIIIVTIFVVIKVVSAVGGKSTKSETTTEATLASTEDSDQVSVPDVAGMTEDDAKAALNKVGLGCKISKQNSDTVAEGNVISQSQKAGSKVDKNTTITITVSSGSNTFTVPNVVGKTESDASSTLKNAGLTVSIDYSYSDSVSQGNVISQTPSKGSSVKSGDSVTINVSRGKETKTVTVPNVIGLTESQANEALDNAGLKYSVSTSQESSSEKGTVIGQSYSSGKEVEEGTVIQLTLSAGPKQTEAATEKSTKASTSDKTGTN